jgi:aminoglycoside phosphotransferase (APT) family kinase protein
MIPGAPLESQWMRAEPRRVLPHALLERIVDSAFPGHRVVDLQPFPDGLRNANFRLRLNSGPELVLRIYEHDASLCQKELDLLQLVRSSVPVPEVIYAQARGWDDLPPYAIFRYVEGVSFRELKRTGDAGSISQAAFSIGEALASIARNTFSGSGWLGPGAQVTAPLLKGADPVPRFIDLCLASPNLISRTGVELRERSREYVWSFGPQLASLDDERHLVHGDFGKRNLLVRQVAGTWTVAAVLDWEFAVSGSPLIDIGHFLRYECVSRPIVEPHFSDGFLRAGGTPPADWRQLARVVDLIALCESLTHDELPAAVVTELVELICAAVEARDPRFA